MRSFKCMNESITADRVKQMLAAEHLLNKRVLLTSVTHIMYQHLLNNTTLCANWSLPWGVLRS